jgi:putative heme transporter
MRAIFLLVTAVSLYVVWPSLLQVTSAWPNLRKLNPIWFLLMPAAEAVSLACIWSLQATVLQTRRWFLIGTAQLSSNAFAKIVPGGPAAGGALQYSMLTAGGLDGTRVAGGLTAASLISTATLTTLPLFSLPAILGGAPVHRGLVEAALLGAVFFVAFVSGGALLLATDGPLLLLGRIAVAVFRRLPRSVRPKAGEDDLPERLVRERDQIRTILGARWWLALLEAAGNWGFDYLALLFALVAVGAKPRPSLVILAYVSAAVLGMIPLTPGGLGFVEAGLTATLALAGIPSGQAVLAVLAYRLASYWLPLVAGAVAWGLHRRRFQAVTEDAV